MRNFIDIIEEANRKKPSPAEKFVELAKAPPSDDCQFEISNKNTVVCLWLEGTGGVVPHIVELADKLKVELKLVIEVYGRNDGGKLVLYYQKHGFEIVGSDFPDNFDFRKMKNGGLELQGNVFMDRKPR